MTEIDHPRMSVDATRSLPVLAFADIRPIIRLRNLKTFTVRYVHPIEITDDQIESLAANLPQLEELVLNAYPTFAPEPTLTLRAIISFVVHCPNLKKLALYLRTSSFDLSFFIETGFLHLSQLCIGYSTVSDDIACVSRFLFPLLPVKCELLASNDED